jgi:hypothetical protein
MGLGPADFPSLIRRSDSGKRSHAEIAFRELQHRVNSDGGKRRMCPHRLAALTSKAFRVAAYNSNWLRPRVFSYLIPGSCSRETATRLMPGNYFGVLPISMVLPRRRPVPPILERQSSNRNVYKELDGHERK